MRGARAMGAGRGGSAIRAAPGALRLERGRRSGGSPRRVGRPEDAPRGAGGWRARGAHAEGPPPGSAQLWGARGGARREGCLAWPPPR